jgi:hypothetical protein
LEIGKISKIVLSAKESLEKHPDLLIYAGISLEGDILTVYMNGKNSISNGSSSNVVKLIQSLY